MNKEQLAFLAGGLAFGILIGFGAYHAVLQVPELAAAGAQGAAPGPMGPPAPTQTGPNASGGAPMVAEINRLKRLLQEDPENPKILRRLGNIYHDAAMWQQAIDYYERVVANDATDPDLMTDLGICYRGLKRFDKAMELFRKANEADPKHWQSLYNMVIVAGIDAGQVDVAMAALEAIESMDPKPAELPPGQLDQLRHAIEQTRAAREAGDQS